MQGVSFDGRLYLTQSFQVMPASRVGTRGVYRIVEGQGLGINLEWISCKAVCVPPYDAVPQCTKAASVAHAVLLFSHVGIRFANSARNLQLFIVS